MAATKIILTYLPPATIFYPSSAFSILKSFLEQQGYDVEIKYWNFLLNSIISQQLDEEITDVESKLMPFYGILADMYNDNDSENKILSYLHKLRPSYIIKGEDKYREYLEEIKAKVYEILISEIEKIDFSKVLLFGISYKLLQLVPGIILAKLIKERHPNVKIVIGGIGNKAIAYEVMQTCEYFDYAIWGEGEYPLLQLADQLKGNKKEYKAIPRLVYRDKKFEILHSETSRSLYLDFSNYIFPSFEEYNPFVKDIRALSERGLAFHPINSIRSCHWKKCAFCNYNTGYKYRERPPENIVDEIDYMITKHGITDFQFVDNDIIGTSIERFEELLDRLIEYKENTKHNFHLWGEMIPHWGLNEAIISKMFQANFYEIFIGYEAITDTLLQKMNKSNDFAMNIFIVKAALRNNINLRTNIIKAVPDETKEDVLESMNNLHYLRFYFNIYKYKLIHDKGQFTLYKESAYYKRMDKQKIKEYNQNPYPYYLPNDFLQPDTNLFGYYKGVPDNAAEWYAFSQVEQFYKRNKFDYDFEETQEGIAYNEYVDGEYVDGYVFNEMDYVDVLTFTNDAVRSFDELYEMLKKKYSKFKKDRLVEVLTNLKAAYLLYFNANMTRIISVVDVRRIKKRD